MSDARTLSARKTLYLDAPTVSIQTGPDPRGFEVGGFSLGNWKHEFPITYQGIIPPTPGWGNAAVTRIGATVEASLPPTFSAVAATSAGDTITMTPAINAGNEWSDAPHPAYYATKVTVNGTLVNASISLGIGAEIVLDSSVNIGDTISLPGFFFSYLGVNV